IPNYDSLGIRELIYYLSIIRTHRYSRAVYYPENRIQTTVHYIEASEARVDKEHWNTYTAEPMKLYTVKGGHY
ncbi:MAG: hypothetical protein GY757_42405, partial [bacterium]|nr:hypothetical protein [bacterium]